MTTQPHLPGTQPMTATVPAKRRMGLSMDCGAQAELIETAAELRELKKQHPAAVGLTLALAIIDRRIAVLQAKTSRIILSVAAGAGLPIEGHMLRSNIVGSEIIMEAIPDASEGEPA